jgi:hypothetical protein
MPKQPRMKHVHKLRRHKYRKTGNSVFFCTLPECHYKIEVPLALGKISLCNYCDSEFIIDEYTLKLVKPHCRNCGKVRVTDEEGNSRYVKKVTNQILPHVASETISDLRNRLNSVTAVADEDDI